MTDPQTPATSAGRRLLDALMPVPVYDDVIVEQHALDLRESILAIEAEAAKPAEVHVPLDSYPQTATGRQFYDAQAFYQMRPFDIIAIEAEARASLDVDVLARALCDKPPGVCFDWDIHVTQARNVLPRLRAILDPQP